ncbi:MAG TPA: menaquinone biosynthesis protein, partial [bacterium]|nr:menaquinone biosynthesis protein [bacterium]
PAQPVKFIAKPMNIGVFNFLNIQPLIWDMKNHHKLFPAPPSQMASLLKKGQLDVAIAPVVAKFLNPELQIVPVAAIGCKGPVKSVRLLSHVPLKDVTLIYADTRSQTSVLLARLILKKWYGVKKVEVKGVDMENFKPNQTKPWEASLQFGDIALESAPTGMMVTDLGEEWFLRTQKPFVFAVWMARNVQVAREIEMDLLAAKTEGFKHFQEIVDNYHGIWLFHKPQAKEYLEKNIDYAYTAKEVQGQLEFERLLKEEGLII